MQRLSFGSLAETKKYLKEYKYSSYKDFIGEKRIENKILNLENFPDYFSEKSSFQQYLNDWVNFEENIIPHE